MTAFKSNRRRNTAGSLLAVSLFCGTALWSGQGMAAGALALALPSDVAAQGFAYGYSVNNDSVAEADSDAASTCRGSTDDTNLQSLCKVVQDFSNQCVAVAMDPDDGTSGVGWAVAADSTTAQSTAMTACQNTAGPDRRNYCKIDHFDCDGTAN
jgi:hypothetical protein